MFDRVRELVERDPMLVHARGGDGKTPLHCARTVETAQYLIEHGAEIDARDVDHESTPAQYLVRDAPDVTRVLVEHGAWFDIFIAVGLRDVALTERCLRSDHESLNYRTGQGKYGVAHNGTRAATRDEIGDRRGDIYRWVLDHNISAVEAATRLGFNDIVDLLLRDASPTQRLLAACASANRAAAKAVIVSQPDVVTGLTRDQMRLISDKAHAGDTAAVVLMLDLGFDARVAGPDNADALHWAAFLGNVQMVRALLRHNPPIGVREASHNGTPLDWCVHGSLHGWMQDKGDFATTAQLLVDAGERAEPAALPTGRDDVDGVLRAYLAARGRSTRLLLVLCSPVRKLKLPLLLEIELCRNLFRASHRVVDVGENIRLPDVRMELRTGHQDAPAAGARRTAATCGRKAARDRQDPRVPAIPTRPSPAHAEAA